jgi:SPP1 family predicted phage head-tail adaptor
MPLPRLSQRPPRAGELAPIGALNRQVTFYSPGTPNSSSGKTGPPLAAFSCWAALYALAGDELDKAQQIAQKVTHLAVISYQLGVLESMTIEYLDGGITRTFQIAAIEDPGEQRWQLKIYCFEINQNAGSAS